MDQKEIKNYLKDAKDAIKNKHIQKALNLCKAVLKADPQNYMALVIFGAALQESESKLDAENAYRRAIEISPDRILAWQGLATYFEREQSKNVSDELFSIYKQLLILEKDQEKKEEVLKKIESVIINLNDCKIIEEFSSLLLNDDGKPNFSIENILLTYFQNVTNINEKLLNVYALLLRNRIEKQDELGITYILTYLRVLVQLKDYKSIILLGEKLNIDDICNDKSSLEILCRAYCELSSKGEVLQLNFEKYYESLLKLNEKSIDGLIVKAIVSFSAKEFVTCRAVLYRASEFDVQNWMVHYYLLKIHITLKCFDDALSSIVMVRSLMPVDVHSTIRKDVENYYLYVSSRSENQAECEKCIQVGSSLLSSQPNDCFILECIARAAVTLSKWNIVEESLLKLSMLGNIKEYTFLKAVYVSRKHCPEEAIQIIKNGITEETEFVEYWLLLGELYWTLENKENALTSFLNAAKLAPYIYVTFMYLGHYYREVSKDTNKARRCYEKAFQLNPHCEEVGIALSDTYRVLKLTEKNFELLSNVTTANTSKWAWLRLGLHHLDSGEAESAIHCLRICIRMDQNDSYCWELLGDACYSRGAFIAALKCYQKCRSLNLKSVYVRLQMAIVKRRLGLHDESISELRLIVNENFTYIPALKELAEASISFARELYDKQMLATARDLCEEAADALVRILLQKNEIICAWKLLADSCILVCCLPIKISFMKLPKFLFNVNRVDVAEWDLTMLVIHKASLLDLALRCYQTAVHLVGSDKVTASFLWFDISYCYHLQANFASSNNDRVQQRKLAENAARKSIHLNPKRWEHWNLLGVIARSKEIENVSLAQHCFIKAISVEQENAVVWHNLGTLYLQFQDIQLANEAFQMAQKADPKYSRSWIGQAIIAEIVGHEETADLFYHTTILGYHHESAKGFAEWICKILKDWQMYKNKSHCYYLIEKMYAVQVAIDQLTWYTSHFPDDTTAMNMLGVLLELCNLNRSAARACSASLNNATPKQMDNIYSNLGRQFRKLEKYGEAVCVFQRIKEIDFITQCEFALSLFRNGQQEEAFKGYETAVKLSVDDGYLAQVMVAIAALNYTSNMKSRAQTILLECTRLKTFPIHGLFATCAFGMLNTQLMLSKLVLKELESFKRDKEYTHHIALFNTYCEVFQGNFKSSIIVISKFLFNNPGDASIWLLFCQLLLHLIFLSREDYLKYSSVSAYQAKCAVTLGRNIIDISKISSIISLSYLLAGKGEESLRSSLKAVFLFPDVAENWAVLIAAYYCRGNDFKLLLNMIKHVQEKLTFSKELFKWFNNMEEKVITIIG